MIELVLEEGFVSFWNILVDGSLYARLKKTAFTRQSFQKALAESQGLPEVLFRLARLYGLRLLSKQAYHSHALQTKVLSVGFSEDACSRALLFLQEKGYLDDEAYCRRKVESLQRAGKSPKEIAYRLKQKGMKAGSFQGDELELLRLCLSKKYPKWKSMLLDAKLRNKLFCALLRRGFSIESVQKIVKHGTSEDRDYF